VEAKNKSGQYKGKIITGSGRIIWNYAAGPRDMALFVSYDFLAVATEDKVGLRKLTTPRCSLNRRHGTMTNVERFRPP
jgi:hypothetical protein